MLEINWNPSRRELRQFAAIWVPGFAAFAGAVVAYRSGTWHAATAIWIAAAAVAALGLTWTDTIKPIFVGLMVISYPIGWIVSQTVLAITYYGLFTVVGFALRLFRHEPLELDSDKAARSYWRERSESRDAGVYFRQF